MRVHCTDLSDKNIGIRYGYSVMSSGSGMTGDVESPRGLESKAASGRARAGIQLLWAGVTGGTAAAAFIFGMCVRADR